MNYRTTLQDQLQADQQRRIQHIRREHDDWLSQHNPVVTHAVLLTLEPWRVRAYANRFNSSLTMNSPELLKVYSKALRQMGHTLNRSLFGRAADRYGKSALIVPSFEGLQKDKKPHIHLAIGIPVDRFTGFDTKIQQAWSSSTPFAGYTDTQPTYDNGGWNRYIAKEAVFADRESFDWQSVMLPKS